MLASAGSRQECINELAAQTLAAFGALTLRVTGSSMLPVVQPGDELRIRRCPLDHARVGDVVLFARGRTLFAHRVVRRGTEMLVTRGDSLAADDAPVAAHEFLGKVEHVERRGRTVALRAQPGWGARLASVLFSRSTLAARLFCRLQALRAGQPA